MNEKGLVLTLKSVYNYIVSNLNSDSVENPKVEAREMLCAIKNINFAYIYAHEEEELTQEEFEKVKEFIRKRNDGMPLQYLLGKTEFMSLDFLVNENVLIPRKETELLVEAVIEEVKDLEKVDIVDIGSGSGCIAVSLAYYLKNSFVVSCDISQEAVNCALKNAILNNVEKRTEFIVSDLVENLKDRMFDVVVSNPPYIATEEILTLNKEVKDFEPIIALDGGTDGLYFYRKIVEFLGDILKPSGILAFEVGYNQAHLVFNMMKNHFSSVSIIKDYSNIDRIVLGKGYYG